MPQAGWLKQQTLTSHSSGGLGAHQQYASTISSGVVEGPQFIDGHFLTVSPHGGERGLVLFLLK